MTFTYTEGHHTDPVFFVDRGELKVKSSKSYYVVDVATHGSCLFEYQFDEYPKLRIVDYGDTFFRSEMEAENRLLEVIDSLLQKIERQRKELMITVGKAVSVKYDIHLKRKKEQENAN